MTLGLSPQNPEPTTVSSTTARTVNVRIQLAPAQDPRGSSCSSSVCRLQLCLVHTVVQRCCDCCEFGADYKCPDPIQNVHAHSYKRTAYYLPSSTQGVGGLCCDPSICLSVCLVPVAQEQCIVRTMVTIVYRTLIGNRAMLCPTCTDCVSILYCLCDCTSFTPGPPPTRQRFSYTANLNCTRQERSCCNRSTYFAQSDNRVRRL